jgi:hypothetical protein
MQRSAESSAGKDVLNSPVLNSPLQASRSGDRPTWAMSLINEPSYESSMSPQQPINEPHKRSFESWVGVIPWSRYVVLSLHLV